MKAYPALRQAAWDDANFAKGFVTSACLSAFQDAAGQPDLRRVARHALQGGTALCAGTLAARALQRREYARALFAGMAGAVGVMLVERWLHDGARPRQEN
ncbi:hypothetical protein [Pseudomonas sp. 273]|uniref:hypothetical protein n=1 Tax=Pseudomonas sp. 273 TaxID=75692 RepID=UPI0023D8204D|nr:hypothetical protein [Pseudomonas sp. 273]